MRGTVKSVDATCHIATLDDGREVTCQKLLVATGAKPFRPPMAGVNAQNVFTVKTEADTRKILSQLARNAPCDTMDPVNDSQTPPQAVVIGAGLVDRVKLGRRAVYSLANDAVLSFWATLRQFTEEMSGAAHVARRSS